MDAEKTRAVDPTYVCTPYSVLGLVAACLFLALDRVRSTVHTPYSMHSRLGGSQVCARRFQHRDGVKRKCWRQSNPNPVGLVRKVHMYSTVCIEYPVLRTWRYKGLFMQFRIELAISVPGRSR